jgi:hypothetical protein
MSFARVRQRGIGSRSHVAPPSGRAPAHPVLALQRAIGNSAVSRLLQRAPAGRVTQFRTSFGKRITGRDENEKLEKFAALRAGVIEDATAIVQDLDWDDLWGGLKSDVTGTGDDYSVRVDRQNPTRTHQNIQIQTNGNSVSVATVLVPGSLSRASPNTRAATITAVRAAFLSSLADGMQWEIYDDEPEATTAKPQVPQGKDKGGGKGGGKGGKWNDTRKNRGGGGGGGQRTVGVQ